MHIHFKIGTNMELSWAYSQLLELLSIHFT
jgi:hypothetical protein